jgi:molybdenum cofactor biosynthesis enzyme MoaA
MNVEGTRRLEILFYVMQCNQPCIYCTMNRWDARQNLMPRTGRLLLDQWETRTAYPWVPLSIVLLGGGY